MSESVQAALQRVEVGERSDSPCRHSSLAMTMIESLEEGWHRLDKDYECRCDNHLSLAA